VDNALKKTHWCKVCKTHYRKNCLCKDMESFTPLLNMLRHVWVVLKQDPPMEVLIDTYALYIKRINKI